MKFLQIVLNVPLNQSFTYSVSGSEEEKAKVGCRAEIKFGNRKTTGCILEVFDDFPSQYGCPIEKVRPILRVLDEEPLLTEELANVAKWISSYYLCAIGEAVFAMLPGGKRETEIGGLSFEEDAPDTIERTLSEEQEKAVEEILKSKNTNFHYLYGPTGTGKTEVFLQTAKRLLDEGKGAIYLVPEIGLTPQVIEAVLSRFGPTAALLHSGLTPSQRLAQWKRILNKEARIVIGARSAVFAPVPDLGLIIIDEEHDSSYKSGSTPRYHARQVAMYRCQNLKIPLLMGSATPSVESYYMMNKSVIEKHTLTKRLSGGAMPEIRTINLSRENLSGCISSELESEIKKTISEKKQAILFLNRRGFNHFFRCNSCGFEMKCKNCSVSMTFHKNEKRLRCHYCGWSTEPPAVCPQCGSLDVGYLGFGTEFIENEVKAKFPNARIVRLDTDSLTKKGELQEKLSEFKKGGYDIMLGTQMVAKGLNFPNLKLVGVILADTSLHLPDFRASERTFALITQVAGRAGRFFPDGKVLVQSYSPDREPIYFATKSLVEDFYKTELSQREMLGFPPFSRLVRIVFRSVSNEIAEETSENAAKILQTELSSLIEKNPEDKEIRTTEILGPSECPLSKIAMNYRHQLILRGKKIGIMQKLVASLLYNYTPPQKVYLEVDVDALSLL